MKTKWLQVRVSEDLKNEFNEICSKKHINASDMVRGWIEDFVKNNKEETKMKSVSFIVGAKKYFEVDADRLEQVKEGDLVLVSIDFENKRADYIWYGEHDNPANFPAIEDDFDSVVELWGELGKPV